MSDILKDHLLHQYIKKIKQTNKIDIYSITNATLIINPYVTNFPKNFIFNNVQNENKLKLFVVNTIKFYVYNFVQFFSFIQTFVYYKCLYKRKKYSVSKNTLVKDIAPQQIKTTI